MPKDLTALFSPQSVAVIGASQTPGKVGAIVLNNIINSGFKGPIYPVNPKVTAMEGLKWYKDIASLPEIPDLAVIAIPAEPTLEVLKEVGKKRIKNVVVFAAGFKEVGSEGEKLEQELSDTAQKYGLNILGPNCFGFVNNLCPINTTFGGPAKETGNIRFISQSGAIAASLFDWCKSTGLNFSEFVTLGNKAVINENDVLEYMQNIAEAPLPPESLEYLSTLRPIGLYLESIVDGREFLRITGEISKTNPVFIIKPGKSKAAARAMQSHTGAIAGEASVLDAALKQAGVIHCQTLEEFFDLSRAFSFENIPTAPKVAIISNAGGPAVISADAAVEAGLELAEFDDQTKKRLLGVLPRTASILNPVDVLGDALADRFAQASEIILQRPEVGALVVILTPQIMTQIGPTAEYLVDLSKKYQKPIFCAFIGGSLINEGEYTLNKYKIPVFRFPERAIAALGTMWKWKKQQEKLQVIDEDKALILQNETRIREVIQSALNNKQKALDNLQANEVLSLAEIPTPATQNVANLKQAKTFAQAHGFPLVLKLSAPGLLHKRKIGGVVTGIADENQLLKAWDTLQKNTSRVEPLIRQDLRIQAQKEAPLGIEVIVGVKQDATFGKVLLFGAGGSFAELIGDRNLHLLPVNLSQAKKLVENSKIYSILKGSETTPSYNLDRLYEAIARLGKIAEGSEDILEIEINPLIVTTNDVWAVDGKVVLQQQETSKTSTPKFQSAKVISHSVLTSTFHYYELEPAEAFSFLPGQYISVKVAKDRINCYSIAGSRGQRFNLLVDTSPGGPGSKYYESLKIGDTISYLGPFGAFTFQQEDGGKHLLFLGTGSGFAPLKVMVEAALTTNNLNIPATLYLSHTSSKDVFARDYLKLMSEKYPNFNYKIAVDTPDETWKGDVGFITELIKKDFPDATQLSAYLCGNQEMITDATNLLAERGLPKERIYTEKY